MRQGTKKNIFNLMDLHHIGHCLSHWHIDYHIHNDRDTRAATIQLPHDTICITILTSRYDTYRDTFLTTLEP